MITKYYCDSCGREICGKYARISVEKRVILGNERGELCPVAAQAPIVYADICLNCFNTLPLDAIKPHKAFVSSPDLDS